MDNFVHSIFLLTFIGILLPTMTRPLFYEILVPKLKQAVPTKLLSHKAPDPKVFFAP